MDAERVYSVGASLAIDRIVADPSQVWESVVCTYSPSSTSRRATTAQRHRLHLPPTSCPNSNTNSYATASSHRDDPETRNAIPKPRENSDARRFDHTVQQFRHGKPFEPPLRLPPNTKDVTRKLSHDFLTTRNAPLEEFLMTNAEQPCPETSTLRVLPEDAPKHGTLLHH